jgi:hypothetical protein
LIATLGSLASTAALVLTLNPTNLSAVQWLLVCIAALAFGAIGWLQYRDWRANVRRKVYKTPKKIRDYMYKWISHGSRVAICTRDMSWVVDDEMRQMLSGKARAHELTLCLPTAIPLSDQLMAEGAAVVTYDVLRYVPQSRFTIVRQGRLDSKVAVGRHFPTGHIIEEFALGDHPVFAVANDLVEILTRFAALPAARA